MEEDDFYDGEVDLPYRDPDEIERYELSEALRLPQFLGDDSNLNAGIQSVVVDNFIMLLEYEALRPLQSSLDRYVEALSSPKSIVEITKYSQWQAADTLGLYRLRRFEAGNCDDDEQDAQWNA